MNAESLFSGAGRYVLGGVILAALAAGAFFMMRPEPAGKEPVMADNEVPSKVDPKIRARIDRWIEDNHRNRYGDPAGSSYAGGTPLFDMHTGERHDRYAYILERHPELGDPPPPAADAPSKKKPGTGK
jgi:hypothetical protein